MAKTRLRIDGIRRPVRVAESLGNVSLALLDVDGDPVCSFVPDDDEEARATARCINYHPRLVEALRRAHTTIEFMEVSAGCLTDAGEAERQQRADLLAELEREAQEEDATHAD